MIGRSITVREVMRAMFPRGYFGYDEYRARLHAADDNRKPPARRNKAFDKPPCAAVDLFALAGMLLLRSGAYHHVAPNVPAVSPRTLTIPAEERARWVAAGAAWRGDGATELPAPPPELLQAWTELLGFADQPVFKAAGYTHLSEKWWRAALALFCIADEAARDIGFESGSKSAQADYIEAPIRAKQRSNPKLRGPYSLSAADRDQVCVLPKSRTPRVGCTIRSLSHNLSLLPARGLARAYWSLAPSSREARTTPMEAPFNVVVVPLPFAIRSSAFQGHPSSEGTWGWFDLEPHWCPRTSSADEVPGFEQFYQFIKGVLDEAAADVGSVHALILPEVALSSQIFRLLCDRLQHRANFELLISGLFDAAQPVGDGLRRGNFTGMARFAHVDTEGPKFDISIREKHHRWRLDASQIEAYSLGSALDLSRGWWEHIDILSRSVDVFVLRGGATVTTLICEDLARNDPCQELVRGIGPNFVVALLMDGPQLKSRWPARYATVLADDPGSSVLTLTSYGLISRANAAGQYPPSAKIGLFQDDRGHTTEIQLPTGAHGLCLTLQPTRLVERTLDGRADRGDTQSWRLGGIAPIKVESADVAILRGEWPREQS